MIFYKKATLFLAKIRRTMFSELGQHVGIFDVAAHAFGNRSLPSAFEQIASGYVIEAINASGFERTSAMRHALTLSKFGITLAHAVNHDHGSIIVREVVALPIITDFLVHATNKIRERHIIFQSINIVGLVHV